MYRNVVILLDGSELAESVLPHVAEVIRDRGSCVHLLSVAPVPRGVVPTGVDVRSSADVPEDRSRIQREWVEYLRSVAKKLEPVAADVWLAVRHGRPADEILAFVSSVNADLVAMSTHGRSGITRWVFGTVADRVLRGARCPVLLVRTGRDGVTTSLRETPYKNILIPLDGSKLAEQIVPYVRTLVRPNHTRIYLVSVMTTGMVDRTVTLLTSYPPGLQLAAPAFQYVEAQLQAYLRSVAAALREAGAVVHVVIRQGSPADEVLTYAAEVEVDLIGMTTHGFSGTSRWVHGNVAGKVLQGAQNPVLLVRPKFEQGE
ncbi:MAG: universal stress protein [Chloroflexi bacterium]|nr:universal stress protein [Chloroflexota bacterium]